MNYRDTTQHVKLHISHFHALCGNSTAMFCAESDVKGATDCVGIGIGAWQQRRDGMRTQKLCRLNREPPCRESATLRR